MIGYAHPVERHRTQRLLQLGGIHVNDRLGGQLAARAQSPHRLVRDLVFGLAGQHQGNQNVIALRHRIRQRIVTFVAAHGVDRSRRTQLAHSANARQRLFPACGLPFRLFGRRRIVVVFGWLSFDRRLRFDLDGFGWFEFYWPSGFGFDCDVLASASGFDVVLQLW